MLQFNWISHKNRNKDHFITFNYVKHGLEGKKLGKKINFILYQLFILIVYKKINVKIVEVFYVSKIQGGLSDVWSYNFKYNDFRYKLV